MAVGRCGDRGRGGRGVRPARPDGLTVDVRSALRGGARGGLVARALFYLLLAYLTIRVALLSGHDAQQIDANGALAIVARAPADRVVLGAAGLGFVLFGVSRIVAAVTDRSDSRFARLSALVQGLVSFVVAAVPWEYAVGAAGAGSEQQSRKSAARVLGLPGGRVLVVVAGLVFIGWAVWQIVGAARGDHHEGLHIEGLSRPAHRVVSAVSATGLIARALVLLPIGGFLVAAGIAYDADKVRGLDGELLLLTDHGWGTAVLAVVALGFADFAAYALIEARYRDVLDA